MENIDKDKILEIVLNSEYILISSHSKLSLPIIRRIYKKMINGIKFDDIKVCDKCLIDGHHRFIASKLAEIKIGEAKSSKTSATIEYKWEDVDFVEEEWDTPEKIHRMNELDAEFNNMSLETIINFTK